MCNRLASSIVFLLLLYYLQGVLTGLFQSMKLILSDLNATYLDQGLFHSALFPGTIKLLWAPFIDSFYWQRLGRRKTWLIPTQYMIGSLLVLSSSHVHNVILQQANSGVLSVYSLLGVFTLLSFLTATQDIVVDAWSIVLLPK